MAHPRSADGDERPVVLTVFYEGTSNPLEPITTQIALFARGCTDQQLPEEKAPSFAAKAGNYKLSFPGCAVTHGFRGLVFAHGLKENTGRVFRYVDAFVKAGLPVKVNFVGLSRGGIAGAYLAQDLAAFRRSQVVVNLLLFDPVPGNFVFQAKYLDVPSMTNTNQAMDLRGIENLGHVLVLYPHEPLPALALHAPLLMTFPDGCNLEEDVILGCHQGALFLQRAPDACLSFARIRDYLHFHGSGFDAKAGKSLNVAESDLLELMARELKKNYPTRRFMHAPGGGADVVRRSTGQLLCKFHRQVLERAGKPIPSAPADGSTPEYMLDIER